MNSHKLLAHGPLPIRIPAGITFLAHGLPKFENIAGTSFYDLASISYYSFHSFNSTHLTLPLSISLA